jgi:hypothetical protein
MRRFVRLSPRRVIGLGLAGLAVLLVSATASTAAHPFVSGEPSSRQLTLPASASARAVARATAVGHALALPAGAMSVRRIEDRLEHATYDEVTTRDAAGQPTSVVTLGVEGRLRAAVVLGLHPSSAEVDPATAVSRASAIARAVEFTTNGRPTVVRSAGAGGWLVTWPRIVDGAPVRGDDTRVALWEDGTFHSASTSEHPLAPAPSVTTSSATATQAAQAFVRSRFGSAASSLTASGAALAWVAPNDTWDAARPDAPDATAQLAWIVEYRATGALADRLVAIEVWVEAARLEVIGGDVAE